MKIVFSLLVAALVQGARRDVPKAAPKFNLLNGKSFDAAKASSGSSTMRHRLDLTDLTVDSAASYSFWNTSGTVSYNSAVLVNTSLNGEEVACLNCVPELFARWVAQRMEPEPKTGSAQRASGENEKVNHTKHPNAPEYDEWAKSQSLANTQSEHTKHPNSPKYNDWAKSKKASFLAGSPYATVDIPEVKQYTLAGHAYEAARPRLQTLWQSRRLVVGYSANPMHEPMDFQSALTQLARESPMLTKDDCQRRNMPYCNALFSGDRTASAAQLRKVLDETFGAEFLKQNEAGSELGEKEERKRVQALLKVLKGNYSFYYQKCLTHEPQAASCNPGANSELLGQVSCAPADDEPTDDCVYAEVRRCPKCAEGGGRGRFFEYSRFHGPLALFETKHNRGGLMGQCEEFSRAAHALLASLGYDARYVLDFTDHVWVEVRLPTGSKDGKWYHADPSEGILDNPLMYEKGWGKKLTMIFAFTPQYIEHITHKYTEDYEGTVARRGITDESLNALLKEVNYRLQNELPMSPWGFHFSKNRKLEEIALWTHFESDGPRPIAFPTR